MFRCIFLGHDWAYEPFEGCWPGPAWSSGHIVMECRRCGTFRDRYQRPDLARKDEHICVDEAAVECFIAGTSRCRICGADTTGAA